MLYSNKNLGQLNTASPSLQRSQNDRPGIEHIHEFELQSDISSVTVSSDRRQAQFADVLPSLSGQTKNVSLTA
jgi:hypothetical protein